MLTTVTVRASAIPADSDATSKPGAIADASRTMPPLRTTTPRPSVITVSGSANHSTRGHTSALRRPIKAAAVSAAARLLTLIPLSTAPRATITAVVSNQMTTIRSTGRCR